MFVTFADPSAAERLLQIAEESPSRVDEKHPIFFLRNTLFRGCGAEYHACSHNHGGAGI